jgi:hypothetical protein
VAARRRTAFGYFERWTNPQAVRYVAEMADLLRPTRSWETDAGRWRSWNKRTHEQRLESILFVNFWEELGGLYNRQLVDREVIRLYLGATSVAYWESGAWFVKCAEDEGSGKNPHVFEQWRKMNQDIDLWLETRDKPNLRRRAWNLISKRLLGWL